MSSHYFCGSKGDGTAPVPPGLPAQLVQLALVWPVFDSGNQAGADRICHNIFPFLIVAFASPQLRVPEMALPDRRFRRPRPGSG